MIQTVKQLRIKTKHGNTIQVVREHYLREDVPCNSELCLAGCTQTGNNIINLPKDATHYLVPDCQVARYFLEILEYEEITGIIFMHTVMNSLQHEGGRRIHKRTQNLIKDANKKCTVFHNEFQKYVYSPRTKGETLQTWQTRNVYNGAAWYYDHLVTQMPIVMVTIDNKVFEEYKRKRTGVHVMLLKDYLHTFWPDLSSAHALYESLYHCMEESLNTKGDGYESHVPADILEAGLKSGQYMTGTLHVNKHNAMNEAFLRRSGGSTKEEGKTEDILIYGNTHRNRAIHGDRVVVELLPRTQWKGKSKALTYSEANTDSNDPADDTEEEANTIPTGRVVAVVQRNWRDYVCSFSADDAKNKKAGKVLVIPWDWRIPKIRISTRQAGTLSDERIVVRIDNWETSSQYPNGHFVRSLGTAGDLETEISVLLLENGISVPPFTEAQMKEMPVNTTDNPWTMDPAEVKRRRDIRQSHLVFSIDPKGCEDVDDTLSVRELENGNLELGVHIADVTYFLKPGSYSDIEAKSRSTTVYLADRRYDMLPEILSADLCSLISGVDRYAMSVMWELDSGYNVVGTPWFGRTVIRSQYKLFYEIAQAAADGADDNTLVENIPELQAYSQDELDHRLPSLRWSVTQLMSIARGLQKKRTSEGALALEGSEIKIQIGNSKAIENLIPKQSLEIHDTIAECMIFANHWVAKKICQSFPNQALLRHHPMPRDEHFSNLLNCAESKGFSVQTHSNKVLAESLDKCEDPNDPNVNKLLRSLATQAMSNAAYFSTGTLARDQFFHYGLALDFYTHFTSPIRRYADVVVHRLLLASLGRENIESLPANNQLQELSEHINTKHRAAQNAQKDSTDLFQSLFFTSKQDDPDTCIVDAVIFQIRANGLLLFIPRYGIKGAAYLRNKDGQVLYVTDIDTQEWTGGQLSQSQYSITVHSTFGSQEYRLFDHITVKITVQTLHAHNSNIKLDVIMNAPYVTEDDGGGFKQQKAAMIKNVQQSAEERRQEIDRVELGEHFDEWKKLYGQKTDTFYTVLQSIRHMALFDV